MPLRYGVPTYYIPRFDRENFTRIIDKFQITDTTVVPPIIASLLELGPAKRLLLKSLEYIVCAGAPMHPDVQAKLCALLSPTAVVAQCWGLTETGWITLFNRHEKDASGAVGRLLPNIEIKIIDDVGDPVDGGVVGEACVRSPSLFSGYYIDGHRTSSRDQDGFYHTGDRAHVDQGRVFIDGRIKDVIKVKGWQVSPEEVETILLQHPDVIDAAVVGILETDKFGIQETLPRAFVVLRSDRQGPKSAEGLRLVSAETIQSFVDSRVAPYKRLRGGIVFLPEIPRSATGKVLRRRLIDVS